MSIAMRRELTNEYPTADDREQMGRILRHAFPLGLGSFTGLPEALKEAMWSGDACSEQGPNLPIYGGMRTFNR